MWNYTLNYRGHSAACGYGQTLGEAIGKLAHDVAYYQIACGYRCDKAAEFEETCDVCGGVGTVPRKNTRAKLARKKCPGCKGKPVFQSFEAPIPALNETTLCELRDYQQQRLDDWQAKQTA